MIKANQNSTLTAVDRLGVFVSFTCAVHCAVLPIALAFLPFLGLSIMAHGTFERFMLCLSLLFGITSACWGLRVHRSWKVAPFFIVALLLLGLSRTFAGNAHGAVLCLGGALLSFSHLLNHRLCRACSTCEQSRKEIA
jgi:hypothetical protein